ncbi:hypothetical protein PMAYCL1PPCAC_13759, partial [Pristionchus mayeri]
IYSFSKMSKRPGTSSEDGQIAKRMKTDVTEDEDDEPATDFHVVELANGDKAVINFYFDTNIIALEDFKFVKDLNDLCFTFSRALNEDQEKFPTIFNITLGDKEITMYDSNKDCARCRVGAFLAQYMNESAVVSQSIRMPTEAPTATMKMHISIARKYYLTTLVDDRRAFVWNYCTRGIRVIRKNAVSTTILVPAEVASLFSGFLFTLFYNNSRVVGSRWSKPNWRSTMTFFCRLC